MVALASTTVAWVIFAVILVGWLVYYILNNASARRELGSEIEMAPNRREYYDDETLEGPRLERMQLLGVLMLGVIVIGLPLYWVFEPSRQAGAHERRVEEFEGWGAALFESTANGGFNCAGCHGGMNATGGQAPYAVTDPKTGEVKPVNWYAPALNTVFYRFSEEEVTFILDYGRPFSPMSAWGAPGGGPMTTQNIETLIAYLRSIQIEPIGCLTDEPFDLGNSASRGLVCAGGTVPQATRDEIDGAIQRAAEALVAAGKYDTPEEAMGEAIFDLDLAAGAYSCARCHTQGWSYGEPGVTGQGAYGWNLTGGSVNSHFPNKADMVAFIKAGSVNGARYGLQGQGSGRMPGFGSVLTDEQISAVVDYVRSL